MNLDGYKATPNSDILKLTVDIHLPNKTNKKIINQRSFSWQT